MTHVDFYVLPENATAPLTGFVVKLTEQLYRAGHRMYVHSDHADLTRHLDEQLWVARDISFVPHGLVGQTGDETPVTLGEKDDPDMHEILVNLGHDVPEFFSRYQRVVEVISGDPEQRQQGRVRYKFYKDRGYELKLHNLDKGK